MGKFGPTLLNALPDGWQYTNEPYACPPPGYRWADNGRRYFPDYQVAAVKIKIDPTMTASEAVGWLAKLNDEDVLEYFTEPEKVLQALAVAIDAVRLLEKVKEEAEGVCELCKYGKSDENKPPCNTCLPRYFATGIAPLWEWFNGEFADATQEENEDEQAND